MAFICNKRFSIIDLFDIIIILLSSRIIMMYAQESCLTTNGSRLPVFQGYDDDEGQAGEPDRRIHHQHQAIIPTYKFSCCGNITAWGVDLNPDGDGSGKTFDFILQVWRPFPTLQTDSCYSLVNDYSITSTVIGNGHVATVTPLPQNQLQFEPGDVLGFYVESHGFSSNDDNGVVALNESSHMNELVWHGRITSLTSRSGSCPYPVGTSGVLSTSTHAAPVISISAVMAKTCFRSSYMHSSLLDSVTSTTLLNPTRTSTIFLSPSRRPNHATIPGSSDGTIFLSPSRRPNHATIPGSSDGTIITGIVAAIIVVASIIGAVIIAIVMIIRKQSRIKQANNTGMAHSNQLYDTLKRDQVSAAYECSNSQLRPTNGDNGLYAVNKLNPHYAEIESQYTEIGEKGQIKEVPVRNNDSSHTESRETIASEIVRDELFGVAGVYVPTTEQHSNQEGHYEMQSVNNHIYNKLTFFVEDQTYWAPASTTSDLYSQLASKKYREIPREQLKTSTKLGSGEFGNVYKAVWSISGSTKELAVKTLKPGSSENDRVRFLQEAAIMGQFNHPHVVRLYGVVTMEDPIMICFELMVNGNLGDFLGTLSPNNSASKKLDLQLLRFSREIASGMAYLSKKAFVHRDLAARNILLDEALTCKISDFGMARDLADSTYYTIQSKGGKIPVKWTAPEALFYKKYSTDSDVWSYGMVLFEIWSVGKKPFSEMSNHEVMKKINSGYCQPPPPGTPRPIYQLMVNCWNPTHSQRPPFSKISTTMNESSSTLLQWTGDDRSVAGQLGGQLSEAQFLYQELQNTYMYIMQ